MQKYPKWAASIEKQAQKEANALAGGILLGMKKDEKSMKRAIAQLDLLRFWYVEGYTRGYSDGTKHKGYVRD